MGDVRNLELAAINAGVADPEREVWPWGLNIGLRCPMPLHTDAWAPKVPRTIQKRISIFPILYRKQLLPLDYSFIS
jgi:hypothetical protein